MRLVSTQRECTFNLQRSQIEAHEQSSRKHTVANSFERKTLSYYTGRFALFYIEFFHKFFLTFLVTIHIRSEQTSIIGIRSRFVESLSSGIVRSACSNSNLFRKTQRSTKSSRDAYTLLYEFQLAHNAVVATTKSICKAMNNGRLELRKFRIRFSKFPSRVSSVVERLFKLARASIDVIETRCNSRIAF